MEPTLEMVFAVLRERFPLQLEIAVMQAKLALVEHGSEEVDDGSSE